MYTQHLPRCPFWWLPFWRVPFIFLSRLVCYPCLCLKHLRQRRSIGLPFPLPRDRFACFSFYRCWLCRRCVTTAEGQAFADKHGLLFMEMSARNSAQVERAFIGTAERVSFTCNPRKFVGRCGSVLTDARSVVRVGWFVKKIYVLR